ncbi:MAG TPA: hypothetical protein VGA98_08280 [Allosphingosinicella sp.]
MIRSLLYRRRVNIRICSPVHGDPRAHFAASLVALVIRSMKEGLSLSWGLQSSSSIINSRRALAEEALERGDDYLLWADADHSFPEDALIRLLSHGLDFVGINQPRRMLPTGPSTLGLDGKLVWTTRELAEAGRVEEVAHVGFGLTLIRSEVFRRLPQPWFAMTLGPDGYVDIGEDSWFSGIARKAGFRIYCDHRLSWQSAHIMELSLTNEVAAVQREDFCRARGLPL